MTELTPAERGLLLLRDNLEVFCAQALKIKDQQGNLRPFLWNAGQRFIHESLERQRAETGGMVRALILKGRQLGACFAPHHKVLLADLTWKSIGEMLPGDEVVAVDENVGDSGTTSSGRLMCRRFRRAVVEAVARHTMPTLRVKMKSGRELVVTGDHRMLCLQRGGTYTQWRQMKDVRPGDFIRSAFRPPPSGELTYEDGWFAGILDGEGSRSSPNETAVSVCAAQVDGPVLWRMKDYLKNLGVRYYETVDTRLPGAASKLGPKCVHRLEVGRLADVVYVMNRCLTSRIKFSVADLEGRKIGGSRSCDGEGKQDSWDEVLSVEIGDVIDVVDLQTSAKTYIVDGLVSHNSTYISARFYHRCSMSFGQSAFILAHEQKATDNLYSMVKRYHDNNPYAPSTGATNAKELIFDRLDGGYKLATAGTKDVGRSNTSQLIHASEAAFYDNAQMHMAGIVNTVADMPGTEVIFESTANGAGGNHFHSMWQAAQTGANNYIAIFVPWFWIPHLRAKPKSDLQLSAEDELAMKTYGLDLEQMQWYVNKRATYGEGFEWLAKQEAPMCAEEAFQSPTTNPLISPHHVQAAVNSGYYDEAGALVIGCDPAGDGAGPPDRTCIVFRRGRVVFRVEYHERLNSMQIAGKLADYHRLHQPDAIIVDKGGLGTGIVDRLNELNVPVIGIMFGEAAQDPKLYENRKAEMWYRMRDWFEEHPVRIVNDAAFIADICAPMPDTSSNGRKSVESKVKLARRGIRSPDGGDALALTFAEFVAPGRRSQELMAGAKPYEAPTRAGY